MWRNRLEAWTANPWYAQSEVSLAPPGEFWYDLSLLAEAAPAEEIAPLECELGRRGSRTSCRGVDGAASL